MMKVKGMADVKAETVAIAATQGVPVTGENHVYFYDDVNVSSISRLTQELRSIDSRLRAEYVQRGLSGFPEFPIYLHIHSYGGDVFAGLTAFDVIKNIKSPVNTIIEGTACSAATLLSVAGKQRYITPNSYMMIHQFSSFVYGTYESFKDDMKLQDDLIERFRNLYVKHSKMKYEQVKKMLKHDTWFNASQVIKRGLADELWEVK